MSKGKKGSAAADNMPTIEDLAAKMVQNLKDNNLDLVIGAKVCKEHLIAAVGRGWVDTYLTGEELAIAVGQAIDAEL